MIYVNICLFSFWFQQQASEKSGPEQQQTGKVVECFKNTCLEHSSGKQVNW